ncbi:ribosome-binding factor A [Candidatus Falkowbacteria bacterium RIFOXYC2_FULL_47_12]|uniref:Ribosome-binding factor A n=2 Tax=Candidatus Falkowiibacteriota TaxID=1752728 RepID=A0A1F5TNH9_9BACT|nr:MAG: ribosome-binding factor A [Candidatus Falkowbacteria bacterium RIFOXYA2_FULL_47_9]OGF40417.1 MAG: ribosome-binding factor A [Candidatus Falkowbacteria bacterium RIFOXYC2_FULL_47_12]
MPKRIEQVNELLHREIAAAVARDVELPDVLVTVQNVVTTVDLTSAQVWLSVLPDAKTGTALAAIRRQQGLIYTALKKNTRLRKIPTLTFLFDDTQRNAAEINEVIANL